MKTRVQIISALIRGAGIRATQGITGVEKKTIGRLALAVGEGCSRLLDAKMRNLNAPELQFDEQWSFVNTMQGHLKPESSPDYGDAWTFVCLDVPSRCVLFHLIGKRDQDTTEHFVNNVRARVLGRPHIASDAFRPYPEAIDLAFGDGNVDYGVLKKLYEGDDDTDGDAPSLLDAVEPKPEPRHRVRYKGAEKVLVFGEPTMRKVSTSLIERSNLTTRTWQRRFTRRAITFSKSLRHHVAAVALHYAWYNLGHIHSSLRVTPAMQLGVENHVWSVRELIDAALAAPEPPPLDVSNGPSGPGGQLRFDFKAARERQRDGESSDGTSTRPMLTLIQGGRA
jgi:IS1 family transposase